MATKIYIVNENDIIPDDYDILICTFKKDGENVYDEVSEKQIEEVLGLIDFTLRKDVKRVEF
jgi:hypothetical protein